MKNRMQGSWAVAGLLFVASCGGGSQNPPADAMSSGQAAETAPATASAPLPDGLARARGEWPYFSVRLLEAQTRPSGVLEVRLLLINSSTTGDRVDLAASFGLDPEDEGTMAGVYILDPERSKKYFVLRNADGAPESSAGLGVLDPGQSVEVWARFPAPPEEVERVTIHVPHAEPMTGVPIAR